MAGHTNKNDLTNLSALFDIGRYSGQRNLTRRQWGQQIAKRAVYLQLVEHMCALPVDSEMRGWCSQELGEKVEALFNDPLAAWMPDYEGSAIQPLSLSNMKLLLSNIEKYNDISAKLGRKKIENFAEPIDQLIGLDGNFFGHIKVNLLARDPEIIEAFTSWLQSRRNQYNYPLSKKSIRQNSDNEWIKAGLLPYADLRIWQGYTGRKLKQDETVAMLFKTYQGDSRTKFTAARKAFKQYLNYENALSLICGNGD